MLEKCGSYSELYDGFDWEIPDRFNIGRAVSDVWAERDPERIALISYRGEEEPVRLSFKQLAQQSNAFANALTANGIGRGDRIALMLPQCFETAIAHIAIYKTGAIAIPLSLLFGPDAIAYRLTSAGVKCLVTNREGLAKLEEIGERPGQLELTVSIDAVTGKAPSFEDMIGAASVDFECADTAADDPAMMIFTSGTTGMPKGALHGHRVLLGHIPGVQIHHEFFPQEGDCIWTPADWAWAGGLLNVLLPGLYFGVPVVAGQFKGFDPEAALRLMERMKVKNAFIPPTALRLLKSVNEIRDRFDLSIRTIGSGGEALGKETFDWAKRELGISINEFYGQTECNLVLSSCGAMDISRAGAIGLPVPGHQVAVLNRNGEPVAAGVAGQIAVRRPNPVMFLKYWENDEATKRKFIGDWMLTGDQGTIDTDGYFHFVGRDDDVITSAGYRIGPVEIEDCLVGHPAVKLAAVIGKPDPLRTEIVKAYLVLADGQEPSDDLAADISRYVRERLSAHEYPREIEFVDSMPLTTTGKVIRRFFREREQQQANEE